MFFFMNIQSSGGFIMFNNIQMNMIYVLFIELFFLVNYL